MTISSRPLGSIAEVVDRLFLVLFGGWLGLVVTAALVGAWGMAFG